MSGSSLGGFARSRVGVCGLEIVGRQTDIQRHRIESGGQFREY